MKVLCLGCDLPYPASGVPYRCPHCGGLYDDLSLPKAMHVDPAQPGIWRYLSAIEKNVPPVSLGEGNTPLVSASYQGRQIYLKCEYNNPTGSFKDRGSAVLTAFLKARGVAEAIEDSSGNAGASFAAYAARAGLRARIFVPEHTSGPKRDQIEMFGAELVAIPGPRQRSAEAAILAADAGAVYASHAYLPFNLAGYATCAYEIVEQLGLEPGAVIVPAGQGGLLLGIGRGFQALLQAGEVKNLPRLVGVQAAACAPLFALWENTPTDHLVFGKTLAEGVQNVHPLRADAVLATVKSSAGCIVSVEEARILPGRDALARLGFYVEPTSALVWSALEQKLSELPDPVVVILTGSGYKVRI